MAKVKLQITKDKSLDFSIPRYSREGFVFGVLNTISIASFLGFLFLVLRNTIQASGEGVVEPFYPLLEYLTGFLAIVLCVQIAKVILGGFKYLPETKFDLTFLVVAISLISTLLIKQLFGLDGNTSMLPNENIWHYTILGILMTMLAVYLFDVAFRAKFNTIHLFYIFLAGFEAFLFFDYLANGEIDIAMAYIALALSPLLYAMTFKFQSAWSMLLSLLNTVAVFLFAVFTLNIAILFVFAVVLVLTIVYLVLIKEISVASFKLVLDEFRKLFKPKAKFKLEKIKKELFVWSLVDIAIVLFAIIGGNLIFADTNLRVIESAINGIPDALEQPSKAQEYIIGSEFGYNQDSFLANLFVNYGLVGVLALSGLVGTVMWNTHKLLQLTNKKATTLEYLQFIAIKITVLLVVTSGILLVDLPAQIFILGAILVALVSNKLASKRTMEQAKLLEFKGLDKKYLNIVKLLQFVSIVVGFGLVVYLNLNLEEIFIGS